MGLCLYLTEIVLPPVIAAMCAKTSLREKQFISMKNCVQPTGLFSFKSNSFSYEKFCT